MSRTVGKRCPICGAEAIERTTDPVEVEAAERTYAVADFEYERCTACGESFFFGDQPRQLGEAASAMARADQDLLSGPEIRELRLALGLTQAGLEDLLGVSSSTVGRWERGLYAQSKTADRLMRLFAAHPELIAETGFVAAEGRGPYGRSRSDD